MAWEEDGNCKMGWRGRDPLGDGWYWPRTLWAVDSSDTRERQSWLVLVGVAEKHVCHQQSQSTRGGKSSQGGPGGCRGAEEKQASGARAGGNLAGEGARISKWPGRRGLEAGSRDLPWGLGFGGRGLVRTRLDLLKVCPLSFRPLSFSLFPSQLTSPSF